MLKSYTQQEFNDIFLEPVNYIQDLINYSKVIVEKNVGSSEELELEKNEKYLSLANMVNDCERSKNLYLYFIAELLNKDFMTVHSFFSNELMNFLLPKRIDLWTTTEEEGIARNRISNLMVAQILDYWLPLTCKVFEALGCHITIDVLKEIRDKDAKRQSNILFDCMVEDLGNELFEAYVNSPIVYTVAKLNSHCYQLLYPTLDELYENPTAKNYKDLFGDKKLMSSLMKGDAENE